MKKSPMKEFIISSLSAAVAGYVVKKGYDFFRENEIPKVEVEKESAEDRSLLAKAKGMLNQTSDKAEIFKEEATPAQQGLVATLAYALTAFTVSKFLRKII